METVVYSSAYIGSKDGTLLLAVGDKNKRDNIENVVLTYQSDGSVIIVGNLIFWGHNYETMGKSEYEPDQVMPEYVGEQAVLKVSGFFRRSRTSVVERTVKLGDVKLIGSGQKVVYRTLNYRVENYQIK